MHCGHSCMLSPLPNAQAHFVANARVAQKREERLQEKMVDFANIYDFCRYSGDVRANPK